jgi:enoyl-CoA hydratase
MPDALVERDDYVMTITMNRPKRLNALSGATLVRMYDAFVEASADDGVRCIILTGAEGNFTSGADLKAMAGDSGPDADTEIDVQARMADDPDLMWKALLRHYRPTKPIIAAVEGVAIAGGTEILQGTDIRVAGESAKFGVSEARWSLYPMGGSAVRLARQIPYTVAADILLTGKHITAAEALQVGLVGHVVPDGQALSKAREIAATIAENGPLAVEAILRTLHETEGMNEREALDHEFTYGWEVFASEDSKEGPKAFAEKRKPNFQRR